VAIRRVASSRQYFPAIPPSLAAALCARLEPVDQAICSMLIHGVPPVEIGESLGLASLELEARRGSIVPAIAPRTARTRSADRPRAARAPEPRHDRQRHRGHARPLHGGQDDHRRALHRGGALCGAVRGGLLEDASPEVHPGHLHRLRPVGGELLAAWLCLLAVVRSGGRAGHGGTLVLAVVVLVIVGAVVFCRRRRERRRQMGVTPHSHGGSHPVRSGTDTWPGANPTTAKENS
jgi:hypothetical protein